MNKRIWKKALTAVMTVALMLTSSGMQSITFAKDISIVSVYTNVDKATIAIGETKQLTTYTVPRNATNQDMEFSSSNNKIATVSNKGLVTAVAPGTAKIKVKATDGSGEYETVKITVASNLKITKKSVDSDNEVVLLDKTYGSVTISKSVGNATIYLSNVKIKNTLTLEDGKYKVYMYGTTAKKVNVDKAKSGVKIASLAVSDYKYDIPSLELNDKSKIEEMLAYLGIRCGQDKTSEVENLSLTQKYMEQLNAVIYGFKGKLNIDALSKGYVDAQLVDSKVATATISGDASSKVNLTSEGVSSVGTLTLAKQADLSLSVPADNLLIAKGAKASLIANSKIGTLTNEGSGSQLVIGSTVDKLLSTGDGAKISVKSEGVVTAATLSGQGSSVTGKGTVKAVSVEGNNCAVDTENTEVKIGNVSGTLVQGIAKSGGQTATSVVVPVSTGDSTVTKAPTVAPTTEPSTAPTSGASYKVGDVILNNDFEDGKNNIASIQGSLTMDVADGGNNSTKCLKVSGKTATWNGVGFDLSKYVNNHLTVKISADIKCDVAGALKATVCYNSSNYYGIGSADNAEAGKWYTIEGTYALDSTVSSAKLYFEGPGADGGYYLDNVKITVAAIGDAVPLKGISLDKSTLTMDKGDSNTLIAAFDPTNADNKKVTWESSDANVATVSASGTVKAIGPGTAKITVKSEDGGFTASCDVTVTNNVALALNYGTVLLQSIGDTKTVTVNATGGVTWESADPSVATIDNGTITAMKNGTTTVTAKVGTKSVSCDVVVSDQIVYYEDFESGKNTLVSQADWASKPVVQSDTDEKISYNGSKYLEDTINYGNNGDMVELDNSNGATDAKFVITSYVKGKTVDLPVVYLDNATSNGYGSSQALASKWTKFQSSVITVPAHSTKKTQVRITTSAEKGVILLDCIYITKTMAAADGDHAITGVTLNKTDLKLNKGDSETLSATIAPNNYTTSGTITWKSDNPTVASVDASTGKVIALSAGAAIITATTKVDGVSTEAKTAQCNITVTAVSESVIYQTGFEDGQNPFTNYYGNATSGPVNNGSGVYAVTGTAVQFEGAATEVTGAALSANLKNTWDGIGYKFDKAGVYKISAWVKNNDTTPGLVCFTNPTTNESYAATTINNTEWTQMNYYVPAEAGQTILLVPNWQNSAMNFLIDAFSITKVSTTVIDDSSKENYGFTINGTQAANIEIDNVQNVVAVSGSSITANTYKCASIGLGSDYAGKTIVVSAKVRSTTGGNLAINVNTSSGTVNVAAKYGATADTWYTIQGCATVNGAGELCIATDNDKGIANTTYYFADVVVQVVNP